MAVADRQVFAYSGVLDAGPGQPGSFRAHGLPAIMRECWESGVLLAGYASEDGVGLHYSGTQLHEAVSILPGKQAWHVQPDGTGGYREQPIPARLPGPMLMLA